MKAFVLATGLALAATTGTAQEFLVQGMSDGYLNLRAGPGTNYKILSQLFPDDEVSYVEERGSWLRVRLRNGEVGWASETFLHVFTNYDGTILTVQPSSDGFLNLREGPGTDRAIKGWLYPGDKVVNLDRKGAWIRVQNRKGDFGWAHSSFLAH